MSGHLISFEGIDGVGKTVLSRALVAWLNSQGVAALCYEDIEDKKQGFNLIKKFVKTETSIDASALFYLASAVYKSSQIEELLKKQWVICDRYIDSTIAYHQARGSVVPKLISLSQLPILQPEISFLLVVPEEVRLERVKRRPGFTTDDIKSKTDYPIIQATEEIFKQVSSETIDNSEGLDSALEKVISALKRRDLLA